MTTKSTPKIAARRKIAAAALALGAGVLGTGFAAGVIDLTPGETQGFGTGMTDNLTGQTQMVDVTGQLTINRPMTAEANLKDTTKNPFTATQGEDFEITGWENLTNGQGGTYRIVVRSSNSNEWVELTTGEVPASGKVTVPGRADINGAQRTYEQMAISVTK